MAKQFASTGLGLRPAAWIVTPNDKGRKSIKGGKVFLNDGEEFEIEIFNPLTVSVLADIKLNGQSISKTGLVVKPGQRVYLDCFIDDRKKFKFSTYEVESSLEALSATKNNGLLEVFFYKEDVITLDNWKPRFDRLIVEKWYPVYYPTYFPTYNPPGIYCGTNFPIVGGTITTNVNGLTTTGAYYSSNNNSVNTFTSNTIGGIFPTNSASINSSIETGRVEKGTSSSQKFTEVDMDFENHYIASTIIQILPESRKPAEAKSQKTLSKCKCGSEIKEQFKFCPECGETLKRTKTEIVYIEGSSYEYKGKRYHLQTFNSSLVDLLEMNKNKLIVIDKLNLTENQLRVVVID